MSNNPRDTQFQNFAKLLADELKVTGGYPISEVWTMIAQRAYDLVSHTILNVSMSDLDMLSHKECVERIPDLTVWPEQAEEAKWV
jgi:hypothetical protein